MFPVFFPGIFTFIKSYISLIILASFVAFVSYHYVTIAWYEKKFDQMTTEIAAYRVDIENWNKKGLFSQASVDQLTKYYEKELEKCKSQLKREGELKKEEILNGTNPK